MFLYLFLFFLVCVRCGICSDVFDGIFYIVEVILLSWNCGIVLIDELIWILCCKINVWC